MSDNDTESLKQSIKTSFDKVKDDFMRHNLKIAVLERENIFMRRDLEKLQKIVNEFSETIESGDAIEQEQIFTEPTANTKSQKHILAEVKENSTLLAETEALERIFDKKIKEILDKVPVEMRGSQKSQVLVQEIPVSPSNSETGLETEFLRKLRKNKRDIIKQKILEAIQTKKLTTLELKDLIVDRNKYCSKATFYRYLKELRNQAPLGSLPDGDRDILVVVPRK